MNQQMADPADNAQTEQEVHLSLALKVAGSDKSRPLSDGYCISCDVEIPIKRLEIDPRVERCVDCQSNLELKRKQLGAR